MKNFLITGATSALGKQLCKMIAQNAGARLMMISRSHSNDLKELESDTVQYISGVDLTTLRLNDNFSEIFDEFFTGPISLIHCAGDFWTHFSFLEVSVEKANQIMNSHYLTLYATLQSVLPIMIKKKGGKVATFSYNSMNENFPNMLPFNAAKAAVEATTKCIAHEYAKYGIAANVLSLASLKTEESKYSRPFGDYENYLDLEELCHSILDIVNTSNLITASVIQCYKYSDSYYNQGYFERIKHPNRSWKMIDESHKADQSK